MSSYSFGIFKFNPYRDAKGRFASRGSGGGSSGGGEDRGSGASSNALVDVKMSRGISQLADKAEKESRSLARRLDPNYAFAEGRAQALRTVAKLVPIAVRVSDLRAMISTQMASPSAGVDSIDSSMGKGRAAGYKEAMKHLKLT